MGSSLTSPVADRLPDALHAAPRVENAPQRLVADVLPDEVRVRARDARERRDAGASDETPADVALVEAQVRSILHTFVFHPSPGFNI